MFGSTMLEVIIGLAFCFGCVAVVSSSVYEGIASILKLRASCLLTGLKALLNDSNTGLVKSLYEHALVNPRYSPSSGTSSTQKNLPSYIGAREFACALIDTLQKGPKDMAALKVEIDNLKDDQLRTLLQGIYERSGDNIREMQQELSRWFDIAMDRVSGAYKRQAQLFTFIIGLVLAVVLNIDAIRLAREIWVRQAQVSGVETMGVADASAALTALAKFPIGWIESPTWSNCIGWPIVGWLITSIFALFGAPFWFDVLKRCVNLRGTGPRPDGNGDKQQA